MATEIKTLTLGDMEILPRTHANAVLTSDGYTVEEKLNNFNTIIGAIGTMLDEINGEVI